MPNGLEITKAAIDDFKKIQEYRMAILTVTGVNLTDIDKMKE